MDGGNEPEQTLADETAPEANEEQAAAEIAEQAPAADSEPAADASETADQSSEQAAEEAS